MTVNQLLLSAASRPTGGKFITLWEGRWKDLGEYPSQSEADLALCSYITAEVGSNANEIDRLFRASGLYRPKWDEPHHADGRTYGEGTIQAVLGGGGCSPPGPASPTDVTRLVQLFKTAADLAASSAVGLQPVLLPYLYRGTITKLDGKAKAAGKTTLVLDGTRAKLTGASFLGHQTTAGPVVYLSEQSEPTFAVALRRAGLVGHPDLHLLFFSDASGHRWSDVIAAAGEKCRIVGAELLVIDTIHQFMGLEGESENQSGAVLRAMAPVQALVADGTLAVLLVAHERKGGGGIGESGRGSTAFPGGVDTVLQLTRPDGQGPPNRRVLKAMGRLDVPLELTVERRAIDPAAGATGVGVPAEYIFAVVADTSNPQSADDAQLLNALPTTAVDGVSLKDLAMSLSRKRAALQSQIDRLRRTGALHRCGGGKKGDAYRYYRADDAAGTPIPGSPQQQQYPVAVAL